VREEERNGDLLTLDAEAMRAYGDRTVDVLVDRLCDATIPTAATRVAGRAPRRAADRGGRGLRRAARAPRARRAGVHEPRRPSGLLAFIPFCGTWPGALGDFIASACNIYAGSWMESAGPTQLELEVLRWFCDWIGDPARAGGVIHHTTSAADVQRVRDVLEHADPTIAGPARRVEVIADDEDVVELRAGDFFGELAALDWGAGYGYARIAAVRTVDATTLLTFPAGSMTERARRHPEIAREIRCVGLRRLERDAR
jgi:hypothetical protein